MNILNKSIFNCKFYRNNSKYTHVCLFKLKNVHKLTIPFSVLLSYPVKQKSIAKL